MKNYSYHRKIRGTHDAGLHRTGSARGKLVGLKAFLGQVSLKVLAAWWGLALAGTVAMIVAPVLFLFGSSSAWFAVYVVAIVPVVLVLAVLGALWAAASDRP